MIREEFHLVTNCPICKSVCETWTDTLPRPRTDAESGTETEVIVSHEIECDRCGETSEVVIVAHLMGWSAHLAADPKHIVTVNHLDYGADDWLEELEPEPHPFGNYKTAIAEWKSFLKSIGDRDGSSGINRMLLVQLFSILEAYLSDQVISLVHRNVAVLNAIVSWHDELKDEKVTLIAVAQNPNLVRDVLVSRLRRTQFHRFEHVNGMLRAALDHQLLPVEKPDRDFVMQSAKIRHACVHRNGNDEEGKPLDGLTRQYLERLEALFTAMAESLDESIYEYETADRDIPFGDDDVPFF